MKKYVIVHLQERTRIVYHGSKIYAILAESRLLVYKDKEKLQILPSSSP